MTKIIKNVSENGSDSSLVYTCVLAFRLLRIACQLYIAFLELSEISNSSFVYVLSRIYSRFDANLKTFYPQIKRAAN